MLAEGGEDDLSQLKHQKPNVLLCCVMLIDLGIPFEYLGEPIAFQTNRESQ